MSQASSSTRPWWRQVPPVLWPMPVLDALRMLDTSWSIEGRRVIVADDSDELVQRIWLYELRAATKVHERGGEQVVGIVPEVDWYRQQRDPTYPAVPRPVPVSQLFVELAVHVAEDEQPTLPDQSDVPPSARCASLVPDPAAPPVRWPRVATQERHLTGARCWVLHQDGPRPGWRAVGEPRRAEVGTIDFSAGLDGLDRPTVSTVMPVCREDGWYRLLDTGDLGSTPLASAEVSLVYLE